MLLVQSTLYSFIVHITPHVLGLMIDDVIKLIINIILFLHLLISYNRLAFHQQQWYTPTDSTKVIE